VYNLAGDPRKILIVKTIRLTSAAALGKCDDPTSIVQKAARPTSNQVSVNSGGCRGRRTMVEYRQRKRPHPFGLKITTSIDRLAVLGQAVRKSSDLP
jgi:hypothetical protein